MDWCVAEWVYMFIRYIWGWRGGVYDLCASRDDKVGMDDKMGMMSVGMANVCELKQR